MPSQSGGRRRWLINLAFVVAAALLGAIGVVLLSPAMSRQALTLPDRAIVQDLDERGRYLNGLINEREGAVRQT